MGTKYKEHSMASAIGFMFIFVFASLGVALARNDSSFDENYMVTWGQGHVSFLNQGREVQLSMDKSSGAGFGSKFNYGSGFFQMKMKIPKRDCAGVVTTFYLSSNTDQHDELDFEFLGNREGKPYLLQTNVFANGVGNREQRIQPWFDPSESFHDYKILWNPYQIVFFVDDIPIRVFKNKTSNGVKYPSKPMQILSSLWDGEDWATDGGKEKTDWTQAPFIAGYQGFSVDGCRSSDWEGCSSSSFWWNSAEYSSLSPAQQKAYEDAKNYVTYDYCSDRPRFPTPPPECPQ